MKRASIFGALLAIVALPAAAHAYPQPLTPKIDKDPVITVPKDYKPQVSKLGIARDGVTIRTAGYPHPTDTKRGSTETISLDIWGLTPENIKDKRIAFQVFEAAGKRTLHWSDVSPPAAEHAAAVIEWATTFRAIGTRRVRMGIVDMRTHEWWLFTEVTCEVKDK